VCEVEVDHVEFISLEDSHICTVETEPWWY